MSILHVTSELEPLKRSGLLASWVWDSVRREGGKVLLIGYDGRTVIDGVEVIGGGSAPRVATSDIVEWTFIELFTTLAEAPYRLDPRGLKVVEGHEWMGALVAYILSKRLNLPFRYSIYTREEERGGSGLVSETVKSIESFLEAEADEVVEKLKGRVSRRRAAGAPSPAKSSGVLHVSWEYPPHVVGGLGRAVTSIARKMAAHTTTCVLTLGLPGRVYDETNDNLMVLRVDPFRLRSTGLVSWVYAFNLLMIAKVLESGFRPKIIHAHDWLSAPASVALKHLLKVPLIATMHATEYGRSRGSISTPMQSQIHYWEWRLTYEAWRVFVCSHSMKGEVMAAFSLPSDKLTVLPNGIDLEEVDAHVPAPGERDRYALPWERIVFFAGRHVYDKGVDVLIEAARMVLSRRGDAKFVIAGDGPMRMHLEWMARSYGLGSKVLFTGRISDSELYKAMRLADIVVIPSRYEPFGIVALEAMAAAKPVVASRVGGLAEIVEDGVTGLLVPPEDPGALAAAIEHLLNNPELAREMGLRGRRRVEELYRWDKIVRYLLHVYRRVLEEYSVCGWRALFDYAQPA
ncbi:MAG: glycosyltransferase family 4 protein [Thermofilaceae archaeon]